MRYVTPVRVCLLLLLLLIPSMPAAAQATGIKATDAAWTKAMKANDLEGVVACYAPDAVAWLPDVPEAVGTAAIRAGYKGLLDANTVKDVVLTPIASKTSGDMSTGWGHFTMTLAPKAGGEAVTMKGRYLASAQQRNGRWVYVVDHASAEPPAQPVK